MPCYHPWAAYRTPHGITAKLKAGDEDLGTMLMPCRQCIGCRLKRAKEWALRVMHESKMHSSSCFLTLTYAPENLPANGSLHYPDVQKFLRRLRKKYPEQTIRFYLCGEYGEINDRPHYHICLFGLFPEDSTPTQLLNKNFKYYNSPTLAALWPQGHITLSNLTPETAAYTAGYVLQKLTGALGETHYGERVPPFNRMSLKPGIAAEWLHEFHTDVYNYDHVVVNGKPGRPPGYYDQQLKKSDAYRLDELLEQRANQARSNVAEHTPARLEARETVALAKYNLSKRTL
ncbi:MAG: replication initiator protein [Microvirus sp.]|nr:MAG: replication initiator protein [Microvirus sp.]